MFGPCAELLQHAQEIDALAMPVVMAETTMLNTFVPICVPLPPWISAWTCRMQPARRRVRVAARTR
jgi:hypothetical protein